MLTGDFVSTRKSVVFFNICLLTSQQFYIQACAVAAWVPQVDFHFVQACPLFSSCHNNAVLIELAFTGTASKNIAVAAYNTEEICNCVIYPSLGPVPIGL